jgi:hypothetical protein
LLFAAHPRAKVPAALARAKLAAYRITLLINVLVLEWFWHRNGLAPEVHEWARRTWRLKDLLVLMGASELRLWSIPSLRVQKKEVGPMSSVLIFLFSWRVTQRFGAALVWDRCRCRRTALGSTGPTSRSPRPGWAGRRASRFEKD